jgi:stage II sporulation protein D
VQANFWLGVPGKLRRSFRGTLEICAHSGVLEATVTMPLETAVASVVAAESPSDAGIEALKAQAVAARSFLAARQTAHVGFDFCDTTHCQFLRSPPAANSPAAVAALATRGQILVWHDDASAQDKTLAAMYARSCGGHTRTLKEIGIKSSGYPYYAVRCVYCSRHPEVWQRVTAPTIQTEHDRLAFNRIHGWGAIPSLGDSSQDGRVISGKGIGHGLGLCQLGAADMARHGVGYAEILAHYYPNTRLTGVPSL